MRLISNTLCFVIALGTAACGGETPNAADPTSSASMGKADIVATAEGAGSFKTLLKALEAADLVTTLHGEGPFTVFAPTDDAFKKLPPGTVESLLKPENKERLKAVLTYHVVPGKVVAAEAVKLTSAKTVNGKDLKLSASGSELKVGSATVIKADVMASNGVIHVVDAVILPE